MTGTDAAGSQDPPHKDASRWDALIESVGPDSMLVAIAAAMSDDLKARTSPEDIWQETLIQAWRDRDQHEWSGPRAYRAWLLQIARHRILDANKHAKAKVRGGDRKAMELPASTVGELPAGSKSVSSIAGHSERARLMQQALAELPEELRIVLQLRLFDDLTMEDVARQLQIPASTAWYRFRKAAEIYVARLKQLMTLSSFEGAATPDSTPPT